MRGKCYCHTMEEKGRAERRKNKVADWRKVYTGNKDF